MNKNLPETCQRGNAVLETLLLGLLFLLPLLWGLVVLAEAHRAAIGITAAAREAGFGAARAGTTMEADRAVDEGVAVALAEHGLDPGRAEVRWSGSLVRGGRVEVEVQYRVPVLHVPWLGDRASIILVARHDASVDPYRSRVDSSRSPP